jgi:SSS family transporter
VNELLPLDAYGLAFIGLYLVVLLGIGWFGFRSRKENSLRDFYLGGQGVGFIVLLLTLYSTQYSGNTLFGFTGRAYRSGFSWAMCVHFMTAIVCVYVFFAPRLHRLARRHGFVTPSDFLHFRYGHVGLSFTATIVMVVAIANYLLAQLMAMGRALEGLTSFDDEQAYVIGVVVLALIIVVYETLGGFRAVAWTDVVQGSVLLIGFVVLVGMVLSRFGGLTSATTILMQESPEKVQVPNANTLREWCSYVILVGLGGALYPQSIQRIYAARSATVLKRSLMVMAFLPLTTTLIAVIVGVVGASVVQGLQGSESDAILTILCRKIQEESAFGYWLVVVIFAAVLAAIMSTADSVLLSISSMLTKDIYGGFMRPDATEKELTRVGKIISWGLIVILSILAIRLRDETLVAMLDRKFDLLVQLSPAFLLGIHLPRLRGRAILLGLLSGVAASVAVATWSELSAWEGKKPWGIHPGLYGLVINLAVVGLFSVGQARAPESDSTAGMTASPG